MHLCYGKRRCKRSALILQGRMRPADPLLHFLLHVAIRQTLAVHPTNVT